jgi:hypothetical protein
MWIAVSMSRHVCELRLLGVLSSLSSLSSMSSLSMARKKATRLMSDHI